jgi:hypothetical protein
MSNSRLGLKVVLCALGAACGASPSERSPATALLDQYAPGLRIGDAIAEARAKLPGLKFPEGGPYVTGPLPKSVDGFDQVRLIDERIFLESRSPADDAQVVRIEFSSDSANAPPRARDRITAAFGKRPRRGCLAGAEGNARDDVDFWTDDDHAGVVLVTPYNGRDTTRAPRSYSRLIFYGGPWTPSEISPTYMGERPCETANDNIR